MQQQVNFGNLKFNVETITVDETSYFKFNNELYIKFDFDKLIIKLQEYYNELNENTTIVCVNNFIITFDLKQKRTAKVFTYTAKISEQGITFYNKIYKTFKEMEPFIMNTDSRKCICYFYLFSLIGCRNESCDRSHFVLDPNNSLKIQFKLNRSQKFLDSGVCENKYRFNECNNRGCTKSHKLYGKFLDDLIGRNVYEEYQDVIRRHKKLLSFKNSIKPNNHSDY